MLLNPYFGNYGGQYVAELLIPALNQLEAAFVDAQKDPAFQKELTDLLVNYAGAPHPSHSAAISPAAPRQRFT